MKRWSAEQQLLLADMCLEDKWKKFFAETDFCISSATKRHGNEKNELFRF